MDCDLRLISRQSLYTPGANISFTVSLSNCLLIFTSSVTAREGLGHAMDKRPTDGPQIRPWTTGSEELKLIYIDQSIALVDNSSSNKNNIFTAKETLAKRKRGYA